MNGNDFKRIRDMFDAIIKPEIVNIKEGIKEIKEMNLDQNKSLTNHEAKIATNKTNIEGTQKAFRNYIIIAGFILSLVTFLVNILSK